MRNLKKSLHLNFSFTCLPTTCKYFRLDIKSPDLSSPMYTLYNMQLWKCCRDIWLFCQGQCSTFLTLRWFDGSREYNQCVPVFPRCSSRVKCIASLRKKEAIRTECGTFFSLKSLSLPWSASSFTLLSFSQEKDKRPLTAGRRVARALIPF